MERNSRTSSRACRLKCRGRMQEKWPRAREVLQSPERALTQASMRVKKEQGTRYILWRKNGTGALFLCRPESQEYLIYLHTAPLFSLLLFILQSFFVQTLQHYLRNITLNHLISCIIQTHQNTDYTPLTLFPASAKAAPTLSLPACALHASMTTKAAMASTIGTALGTTQGSCLPFASNTPVVPSY